MNICKIDSKQCIYNGFWKKEPTECFEDGLSNKALALCITCSGAKATCSLRVQFEDGAGEVERFAIGLNAVDLKGIISN